MRVCHLLLVPVLMVAACANGAEDSTEVLGSVESTEARQVIVTSSEPLPTTPVGVAADSTTSTARSSLQTSTTTTTLAALPATTLRSTSAAPTEAPEPQPAGTDGVELIPPASLVASTTTVAQTTTTLAVTGSTTTIAGTTTTRSVDQFVLAVDDSGLASITVTPGALVVVVNNASEQHSVTSVTTDPAARFDTGLIDVGATGSFSAPDAAGSYRFFSSSAPNLSGFLTVSD